MKYFSSVAGYKINIQKSIASIYTNSNQLEDTTIEKTPLMLSTKIKCLAINLTKKCVKFI